ncbi:MAG: DUF4296 domain-containing protein [Prolixibacteraceae bacterium]|nr:DUF4296 domain-containing protein [Prolixibacteraceae bacterium]
MQKHIYIIVILLFTLLSCEKEVVEKPKNLVSRDKMINIIVDLHLSDAVFQSRRYSSDQLRKFSEADLYHSVLKKYNVADSVFEKSLIHYASQPKELERMYSKVVGKLKEKEERLLKQEILEKEKELLENAAKPMEKEIEATAE